MGKLREHIEISSIGNIRESKETKQEKISKNMG
jgi:hypothetical protein